MKNNTFKWDQAFEALTDIKVWLLVLYYLASSVPNGAFTTFGSLVIKGLGFSTLETYLLQMPTGAIHAAFALGSTFLCTKFKNSRCLIAILLGIVSLVGSILVRFGPNNGSKLAGFYLFVAYAAGIPIGLSMVTSNVAGFTKKAVTTAMMFVAYCVGNIIGPFLFFPSQAPIYSVRCTIMLTCENFANPCNRVDSSAPRPALALRSSSLARFVLCSRVKTLAVTSFRSAMVEDSLVKLRVLI